MAVSGSVNPTDAIWSSASIDDIVELMAPSWKIESAVLATFPFMYLSGSGTSFAAPHVAGAWAILTQAIEDLEASPDTSVDRILTLLQSTGVPIDDTRSGGTVTDMPRIDLCAALAELGVTSGVDLEVKAMLQGAFRDVDAGTGFIPGSIMRDTLRELEVVDGYHSDFLPRREPYSAMFGFGNSERISSMSTVLADYGSDSIVDWIFIELRDTTSPAMILATRAALLQRDGGRPPGRHDGKCREFGCNRQHAQQFPELLLTPPEVEGRF